VVLTVRVEFPEPFDTEDGLNEQLGGAVVVAEPLRVMLQESVTPALNPPVGEMEMVEVADPPGATDAGEIAVAEIVKLGGTCTTREREALCLSNPEVPFTLTG